MENKQANAQAEQLAYLQDQQVKNNKENGQLTITIEEKRHENQFQNEEKPNPKDQLIQKLENSNRLITNQVQLIWEKLNDSSKHNKKYQKATTTQISSQPLQKELKNAYHLIKIIEKQIERFRKKEKSSIEALDRIKQAQDYLSKKEALALQLKNNLLLKQKDAKELERQIISKQGRDTSAQLRAMTDELKNLYEAVKESQKKEEDRLRNLKRQFQEIKKIEKQLTEKGMSSAELQQIKNKAIIEILPKSASKYQNQQVNITADKPDHNLKQKEHKSKKRFEEMIYEIKVLQKKQAEFQQLFSLLDSQKGKIALKNKQIESKIEDCQTQIESLQNLSEKLRSKHLFRYRKKQRMKSLQIKKAQEEKLAQVKLNRQKLKQSYEKRSRRYKSLPSSTLKSKTKQEGSKQQIKANLLVQPSQQLQQGAATISIQKQLEDQEKINSLSRISRQITIFNMETNQQATTQNTINKKRNFKYGQGSPNSNKFNDTYILGHEHSNKKIIELTLYFQPRMLYITGLSVLYEGGIRGGDYVWRTASDTNSYKVETHHCVDCYVRDIYAQFEERQDKMMLIGVEIELSNGKHHQFGRVFSYSSKLNQKEYVSCISGNMSLHEQCGRINSVIEQLSMAILMI